MADVFRRYGEAWRAENAARLSSGQRRVMTAIELCRTAALGGHVERCDDCSHTRIAYNSCRNRHCPKCQWWAAEAWLGARKGLARSLFPRRLHAAGVDRRHRLLHVLPDGLHRIRHYGLFANGHRAEKLALCRKLLDVPVVARIEDDASGAKAETDEPPPCPCCGGRMRLIETFERGTKPHSEASVMRFDTS